MSAPSTRSVALPVDERGARFGPPEWGLSVAIALVWGSSFLWIAVAIDHVAVTVVPAARCAFGVAALALFPSARRRIARADVGRFALVGLVWMGAPFLLYPLAERTVNTSITGMINGGIPVVTTVVTAWFTRTMPSRLRVLAVTVGAAGIATISFASMGDEGGADAAGIVMLLVALVCYAVAANLARPLQAVYGALPTMLWVTIWGTIWSTPLGLVGFASGGMTWAAFGALFVLGFVGTGLAFSMYGVLLLRAGPVRGMIGIFFTPIVGVVLGVALRDDDLHPLALVGMAVVIVGAVLTSRPEPAR
ncbi:MAG: DMT family transporter [Acidimicrobiales bacterium]|nr:DMT family transporter [Acidimicrobiales bacterium]MCB9392114.1 DMT family transporter [Acidimicrobiaceae bacterium]